jgi:hypothetical protein
MRAPRKRCQKNLNVEYGRYGRYLNSLLRETFSKAYARLRVTILRMSEKRNCMPEKRFCMQIKKKHNPKKKFAFLKKSFACRNYACLKEFFFMPQKKFACLKKKLHA